MPSAENLNSMLSSKVTFSFSLSDYNAKIPKKKKIYFPYLHVIIVPVFPSWAKQLTITW